MPDFPNFIWSNAGALTLAIVGMLLANIYLLYSIRLGGSSQRAIEDLRSRKLRTNRVILMTIPVVCVATLLALIVWYNIQRPIEAPPKSAPTPKPTPSATTSPGS